MPSDAVKILPEGQSEVRKNPSRPPIAGPCVHRFHIKALPLGFLVSSQLILFETVMTHAVRELWLPAPIQPVIGITLSFSDLYPELPFSLFPHFQFSWVQTSLCVPKYFWRSLWWLCKSEGRRRRGPFLLPSSSLQFKLLEYVCVCACARVCTCV